MYEEKNFKKINWASIGIKIGIGFIILLALFLFFNAINKSSLKDNSTKEYSTNLKDMKTAAFEYFTTENLPEKVGETSKVSLGQMVNQKMLYDFTNNGKTCNLDDSYVKATKTSDNNFALKVQLNCGKSEDYIVTTIEAKKDCAENCPVVEVEKEQPTEEVVKKDVTPKQSQTKTTVNKNVTVNKHVNYFTITVPCVGCAETPVKDDTKDKDNKDNTNNNNNNNNNNNKKDEKVDKTSTKTLWYEHRKKEKITYYNYCLEKYNTVYTTSWIGAQTQSYFSYNYTLKLLDTKNIRPNTVQIYNSQYFSSLSDYQNYLNNRGKDLEMVNNSSYYSVNNISASSLRNSSLTSNNFRYSIGQPYKSGNYYYTNVTITYYNNYDVTPYYFNNANGYIYFVPFKFNISYGSNNDCFLDLASKKRTHYSGYTIVDTEVKTEYTYYWSTKKSVSGYTYTGVSEYR